MGLPADNRGASRPPAPNYRLIADGAAPNTNQAGLHGPNDSSLIPRNKESRRVPPDAEVGSQDRVGLELGELLEQITLAAPDAFEHPVIHVEFERHRKLSTPLRHRSSRITWSASPPRPVD